MIPSVLMAMPYVINSLKNAEVGNKFYVRGVGIVEVIDLTKKIITCATGLGEVLKFSRETGFITRTKDENKQNYYLGRKVV